jgi:transposase
MTSAHIITRDDSIADLRLIIKQSTDDAQKTRIRAIIKIKEGLTHSQTAQELVVSRDSITAWVQIYDEYGAGALIFSKGGRPKGNSKWDTAVFDNLAKEVTETKKYWSIPLMMKWITENYKLEIPEQTVWYHMNERRMSYKSARPHPHLGDVTAQEAFKKGASKRLSVE